MRARPRIRLGARRPLAWSWRLPLAASGVLAGQLLRDQPSGLPGWPFAAMALAAAQVARLSRAAGAAMAILGIGGLLGVAQPSLLRVLAPRCSLADRASGRTVELDASVLRIVAPANPLGRGGVLLRVHRIDGRALTWCGPRDAMIRSASTLDVQPADEVRWRVKLRPLFGSCNDGEDRALAWWRSRGVAMVGDVAGPPTRATDGRGSSGHGSGACLRCRIERLRSAITEEISRAGEPEAASVLRALVVGDASRIPRSLREAYARSGTAHVISVSGLHLSIVLLVVRWLLRRLLARSQRLLTIGRVDAVASLLAVAPATAYCLLAGAEVAAVRSLVMGTVGFVSVAAGRAAAFLPTVAVAALLVALADPDVAQDVSFQLSFASVLAIVAAEARWRRVLAGSPGRTSSRSWRARALRTLAGAMAASLAATLGTAPFTILHLGGVSWIGVVANPVVVPAIGTVAVVVGLIGTALLPIVPAAGRLGLQLACAVVQATNPVVRWMASVPGGFLEVSRGNRVLAAGAAGVALAGLAPARTLLADAGKATAVLAATRLILPSLPTLPAADRTWRVLDTPRGVSALDEGREAVVDGGIDEIDLSPSRELVEAVRRRPSAAPRLLGSWVAGGSAGIEGSRLATVLQIPEGTALAADEIACFRHGGTSLRLDRARPPGDGQSRTRGLLDEVQRSGPGERKARSDGQMEWFTSCRRPERDSPAGGTDGEDVSAWPRPCART